MKLAAFIPSLSEGDFPPIKLKIDINIRKHYLKDNQALKPE